MMPADVFVVVIAMYAISRNQRPMMASSRGKTVLVSHSHHTIDTIAVMSTLNITTLIKMSSNFAYPNCFKDVLIKCDEMSRPYFGKQRAG